MVNFVFKRSIFRIKEIAFCSYKDINRKNCDVINLHSNDDVDDSNDGLECVVKKQYTLENNLLLTEEEIWMLFRKTYRNEIRRVEKEEAVVNYYDNNDKAVLDKFENTYNNMFNSKNINNKFNRRLVEGGISEGQIIISCCKSNDEDGIEVFHAYLYDNKKTVLMYSASPLWEDGDKDIANKIGRMNKYLHWMDLKYFKKIGCEIYEWGGINSVENPNGIAKFKLGFGGTVKVYYNYVIACSLIGKLYVYLVKRKISK